MANLTKPVLGWSGRQLRRIVTGASAAAAIMVVTFIGAASFTTSASAQQQVCLLHDVAVDKLQAQYGEQVSGRGLAQEGRAMVELFRSETGSWTLVITDVNGRSCVMATGEALARQHPQGRGLVMKPAAHAGATVRLGPIKSFVGLSR